MSFPLSSNVNAGDATEAAQYNNLRADAVYLGADPSASGTIRDLLVLQMSGISLSRISKTTIRLGATADEPAAVMIGGKICSASTSMTITPDPAVMTAKGRYYVYATPDNAGSFTIGAGASAPSGSRTIGTFLWSGTGIIPGSVQDIRTYEMNQETKDLKRACGRLTLASGVPVPESDILTANTLYFTPYAGNEIGLKIGSEWALFEFAELSVSLSGLQRELPYDVFIKADEDGLSLSLSPWGSASARLTGIAYSEGVPVSVADGSQRYLGTVAVNESGFGEDSETGRLVWNMNNRVARSFVSVPPDTAVSAVNQSVWAPYFDADAPAVRALVPMAETDLDLEGIGISTAITETDRSYSRGAAIGIGQDMAMSTPYTGNRTCVPVFLATFGNGPVTVRIKNSSPVFRGYHRYTLAFWTNYTFQPAGLTFRTALGEHPGLYGAIMG